MEEPFEYVKSREEMEESLRATIRQLRRSAAAYDSGDFDEAQRLATSVYTLFADVAGNRALTRQLGIRSSLRFPDARSYTKKAARRKTMIGPPLCNVAPDYYRPHITDTPGARYPLTLFGGWWPAFAFRTKSGRELSRKDLVVSLSNQDGGRHVDPTIRNPAYYELRTTGDVHFRHRDDGSYALYWDPKWRRGGPGTGVMFRMYHGGGNLKMQIVTDWPPPPDAKPIQHAHYASMRTIAWEADQALIGAGY